MDVKLVIFLPDGKRKSISITRAVTTVGRGEDCEFRIPLISVSRHHCELKIENNLLTVRDLGSSNGTYVNNERIDGVVVIKPGDKLAIGPVLFTVQIDGKPQQITPAKTRWQKLTESSLKGEKAIPSFQSQDQQGSDREGTNNLSALEDMVADALQDEEEGQI